MRRRPMNWPALMLGVQVLALWPVWRWYAVRVADAPEEWWGVLALVTALAVLWQTPAREERPSLLWPALLMLIYAVSYPFLFPLARAVLAVTALTATLSTIRMKTALHPGVWGLLLLALPLLPSLQFYLGFPLRLLVAQVAAPLLRLNGLAVTPGGADLHWGGQTVAIDAPCSGVKMLWAGLYLALTLTCLYRLSPVKTGLAVAGALAAVVLGNSLRATALFYPEAGLLPFPAWGHTGIGVAAFLLTALGIAGWVHLLQKRQSCAST